MLTRFRFHLAEVKDDLNILLLAGVARPDAPVVGVIRNRVQQAESLINSLTLTSMLLAFSRGDTRPRPKVEEEYRLIRSSSPELVAVSDKLDLAVAGAFAVNSPILLGSLLVLLSGLAFWFWMAARARALLNEYFWGSIYDAARIADGRRLASRC
jgi:hypothetical protein